MSVQEILEEIKNNLDKLSKGDLEIEFSSQYEGEYKVLYDSVVNLKERLQQAKQIEFEAKYKSDAIAMLNQHLQGDNSVKEVTSKSLSFIANYFNAAVGTIYYFDTNSKTLHLGATYALDFNTIPKTFSLGVSTVGQVAKEKKEIILEDQLKMTLFVQTSYETTKPKAVYSFPLLYLGELVGVVELGSFVLFNETKKSLLRDLALVLSASLSSALANETVKELLLESQKTNLLLEEQQQLLEENNAQLKEQQQQLEKTNAQLEEQKLQMQESNFELSQLSTQLQDKNDFLQQANRYKSEFLANMSHELRTPLNSIILLSDLLKENPKGILGESELKKASIINSSGNELLRLINDILDLSKIESGKMILHEQIIESKTIVNQIEDVFSQLPHKKGIEFLVEDHYKNQFYSDQDKILQILKNFISNAFKFTQKGYVKLKLFSKDTNIHFCVQDTGIGIEKNQLELIFNAFVQADGSISREYGGTGLGLSICKELAALLGGKIKVESTISQGSLFELILPINQSISSNNDNQKIDYNKQQSANIVDDSQKLSPLDKPFLIFEDDIDVSSVLIEKLHENGEKGLLFQSAKQGLQYLQSHNYLKGIFLDLGLQDMDGIELLKTIKSDITLRNIPIYVISNDHKEFVTQQARRNGAIGYLQKPIHNSDFNTMLSNIIKFNDKVVKDLLVLSNNSLHRKQLVEIIGNSTIKSHPIRTLTEAKESLQKNIFEGIVIDITLQTQIVFDLAKFLNSQKIDIPVIVYSFEKIDPKVVHDLQTILHSVVFKTIEDKNELIDNIDIFLHRSKK